jgi:Zn-dependent protease
MGWGLVISLAAFAAVFFAQQGGRDLRMLWMLIPILIVHEAGHWVAMNAFGYKNMRMFFIPFFGAAVSGRNLNVSGWKKAAVALMGPVPSIVLSILLLVPAIRYDLKWLLELSLISLVVNLFNLVPILPLDGGQLLQAVLFSRSRFLDVLARVFAAGALFMLGVAVGEWVLMLLGGFMAMGIPLSYRLAKVTEELRDEESLSLKSPDGVTVPASSAIVISHRVRAASKGALVPKVLAQQTMSVFENLNARPPGALATIGLLTVYVGSILVAVVGIGVAALAQAGHLDRMFGNNDNPFAALGLAETPLACDGIDRVRATDQANLADRTVLIHATDRETAMADFEALSMKYNDSERVLFGQTIAWTPAAEDADEIDREFAAFEAEGHRVQVLRDREPLSLALQVSAPDKQAAFIEEEIASFSACPAWLNVLPPWSEDWIQSPDLPRWRAMRSLLKEILEIPSASYADQDQALWKERADAARRRDDRRVADIDEQMAQKRAQTATSKLAELSKRHKDANSQKLIEAATPYVLEMFEPVTEEDLSEPDDIEFSPGETSLKDVRGLLGPRIEEPVGRPVPDGEAIIGIGAWAGRTGETLNINVSLPRSGGEMIGLVEWLCTHDGADLRYDIWGLTNEFGNFGGLEGFEE